MKKILINAMTIKEGGGAVVFVKTFNEMIRQNNNIQYFVVIDEVLRSKINVTSQVTILTFPWIKKSPFHLLYWNEIVLPKMIKKLKIDFLYSQINTLPFRKLKCFEFLSVLQAGYFSKDFLELNTKYNTSLRQKIGWEIRKHWVFSSIKKADKVTVPTKALGDEIISQLKIDKNKIAVILPGPGLAEGNVLPKEQKQRNIWRIGYITKYGVQKNFDVLFKAAAELKLKNVPFKLVLTLNEDHSPYHHVKTLIDQYQIDDVIENHGESSETQLRDLYTTLDLFIFPSLCESIGFTLLEAMYYGIPIIAADINTNRELLGEKGLFFRPHDFHKLFNKVMSVINNEKTYFNLSNYSINRSRVFSWKKTGQDTIGILRE